MFTEFINKKLKSAKYKILKDGSCFGEIPELRGVWADAKTKQACKKELQEVLEEWVLLKVRDRERIPGFNVNFDRRSIHA